MQLMSSQQREESVKFISQLTNQVAEKVGLTDGIYNNIGENLEKYIRTGETRFYNKAYNLFSCFVVPKVK